MCQQIDTESEELEQRSFSLRRWLDRHLEEFSDKLAERTPWFHELRRKYWKLIPYDWRPMQVWYRLSCYLWHKYTTVKPRSLKFHTWCDRSHLMPHMMMEILCQFIEEECSPGWVDWEASAHMVEVNGKAVNVRDEMQDLYDWWTKIYLKAYPEAEEALWKIAEKCDAESKFTPIEGNEEFSEWSLEFPDDHSDKVWHACMDEIHTLECCMGAELQLRLHRLIQCIPFMWT